MTCSRIWGRTHKIGIPHACKLSLSSQQNYRIECGIGEL
jgi:hypothetical protein